MGDVIDLYAPERYCLNRKCRRVDCDRHCWSCGQAHDHNKADFPFCTVCELELETDEDIDLKGFWEPPGSTTQSAPRRRKRKYTRSSLDDVLRNIGHNWLREHLDGT